MNIWGWCLWICFLSSKSRALFSSSQPELWTLAGQKGHKNSCISSFFTCFLIVNACECRWMYRMYDNAFAIWYCFRTKEPPEEGTAWFSFPDGRPEGRCEHSKWKIYFFFVKNYFQGSPFLILWGQSPQHMERSTRKPSAGSRKRGPQGPEILVTQ